MENGRKFGGYSAGNQVALPSVIINDGGLVTGVLGVPHFLLEAARAADDKQDAHVIRLSFRRGCISKERASVGRIRHVERSADPRPINGNG